MQNVTPGVIDLESDFLGPPGSPEIKPPEPPVRDRVRAFFAITLTLLFATEVLIGLLFVLFGDAPYNDRVQAAKELAAIFLGPTIALVGTATGFYFGRSNP